MAAKQPDRDLAPEDIAGIDLSLERMIDWWRRNAATLECDAVS